MTKSKALGRGAVTANSGAPRWTRVSSNVPMSPRGEFWRGRLVYYVGDNMNVTDWLNKRYSKVPAVQALLRLRSVVPQTEE